VISVDYQEHDPGAIKARDEIMNSERARSKLSTKEREKKRII
jgi:hypothetical protein